jgi:hypothetical protein
MPRMSFAELVGIIVENDIRLIAAPEVEKEPD